MDILRGNFPDYDAEDDMDLHDVGDDDTGREPPPNPVGQDERRMQVRAYNYWAGLLDGRSFPSIEDLEPEDLPDFGPFSVLLDFTGGIDDPAIQFLGAKLAEECAGSGPMQRLSDVPSRSLLSRITDHYMQILANQAPIGFEAEFVNQRGATILYRGILLPFSSDDESIDFIYGVINWKEMADQKTTDELMLEVEQALEPRVETPREVEPITDWADGPGDIAVHGDNDDEDVLDLVDAIDMDEAAFDLPAPTFGEAADEEDASLAEGFEEDLAESGNENRYASLLGTGSSWDDDEDEDEDIGATAPSVFPYRAEAAPVEPVEAEPVEAEPARFEPEVEQYEAAPLPGALPEVEPAREATQLPATIPPVEAFESEPVDLADWLASARELAQAAKGSEERSRQTLYAAIGRAYDFSIAALDAPEAFNDLVAGSGLTMQDRAPMTPVVKLVFGAEYDKTRLTEYASALSHAHRMGLPRGALADFLTLAPGGLKGVVTAERRLKREEAGKPADPRETPREALARKLRKLDWFGLDEVPMEGNEFTLLVARRMPDGQVVLLGEVDDDLPMLERAARKLLR